MKRNRSLLDNDLYKFTMLFAVMHHFPNAKVRYEFVCRSTVPFAPGTGAELRKIIDSSRNIVLTSEERVAFEQAAPYLPHLFFDFLAGFRLDPSEVAIIQTDGELRIIVEGYWYRTILWEIIIMSELSELNFELKKETPTFSASELEARDQKKGTFFQMYDITVVDFGTRRRYSYTNQDRVVATLKAYGGKNFVGTSNVGLALKHQIKMIGTFAHEWVSGVAALMGYAHANKHAMELWVQTYQGSLGIALTDTFGLDAFLQDFDMKYAKLFDGVRHDSGDPKKFADKIIAHYQRLGIDPLSKTIVYSDGLNPETAQELREYCRGKIKTSFGIGTNLTNDVGVTPLNIVIKLFSIDNKNVIKLSDIPGKHTGDKKTIEVVKELINYQPL